MIQIEDATASAPLEGLEELLLAACKRLQLEGGITFRIGTEAEGRELNSRYRGVNAATDVLSFPIMEDLPDGFYRGDVFICLPVARLQAREAGHSLRRELLILMVHGLLHLAGYDHEQDEGQMNRLQEDLLEALDGSRDTG